MTHLRECVEEARREGSFETSWCCGLTKRIVEGDRVFMLCQGEEPRGIFASGHAISGVFEKPHWDEGEGRADGELRSGSAGRTSESEGRAHPTPGVAQPVRPNGPRAETPRKLTDTQRLSLRGHSTEAGAASLYQNHSSRA